MEKIKLILFTILKNPLTSILAIFIGIFFGFTNKELSHSLAVYGNVYQVLLKMTVLPILVSAIITSLGKFISNKSMSKIFGKIIFTLLLFSFIFAAFGVTVGIIFQPGDISEKNREVISEQVSLQSEILEIELASDFSDEDTTFLSLLKYLPENIFNSLASSKIVAVLVFAILFGLATGTLASKKKHKSIQVVLEFFEEIYEILSSIIGWLIAFLPIALVCIISSEIASSGITIIISSGKLILLFYIFGFALLLLNTIYQSISLKRNLFVSIKNTSYPSLVAFTTRNSIASMSIAITTLHKKMGVDEDFAKSTMPLLTILGRFGNIFYFGLVSIFSSQIYYTRIDPPMLVFLIISIVFAGIATAGASGFVTLGVLSIVMEPLGIPFDTILVILLTIDIIIDPLRTTLIVHTNTILTSVLHKSYNPALAVNIDEPINEHNDA